MKKIIICLSVWAGLAACSREESGLPVDGIRPITFLGYVQDVAPGTRALAGAAVDPKEEVITDSYAPVYIQRTAEERYNGGKYTDMADFAAFSVPMNGTLKSSDGGVWYWNDDKRLLFHAWTRPKNEKGDTLVSVDKSKRFGTVEDFSMNERHQYIYVQEDGKKDTTYFRSNLEYFIGAVQGPVTENSNARLSVKLPFKHLVAKIVVVKIMYIHHDGASENLENAEISFYMPNMPAKAYWTTGVPESVSEWETYEAKEPKVTIEPPTVSEDYPRLGETDFGVSGKLSPGDAFYIYPCKFSDVNDVTKGKFGDIQFRYNNSWFYGSLETITAVQGLEAGQCLGVMLQLKDGTVKGIYPHITDWSDDQSDLPVHDRPGIYDENEWKMFVDWLCSRDTYPGLEPPAGIFGEDGNLNLYGNLDLTADGDASYADIGDLLKKYFDTTEGKKLKGNGHRIKTNKQWSKEDLEDYIDDLYITAEGKNEYFEKPS